MSQINTIPYQIIYYKINNLHYMKKIILQKTKLIILYFVLFISLSLTLTVQAQESPCKNMKQGDKCTVGAYDIQYMGFDEFGDRKFIIKTIDFGDDEKYIDSPFLTDYLSGLYRYAVIITSILATVVIIFAGVVWATSGGNVEKIGRAKKMISRSITGLLLAVGSYTILWTVNPQLVEFGSLKILRVKDVSIADALEFASLDNTTLDTRPDASGNQQTAYAPVISTCPFELSSKDFSTGKADFMKKATQWMQNYSSPNFRSRILAASDLAIACGIDLGSCGNTSGSINSIAGFSSKKAEACRNGTDLKCGGIYKRNTFSLSALQRKFIFNRRCTTSSKKPIANCTNDKQVAKDQVTNYLSAEEKAGRLKGWPNEWVNSMRPGDYVVFYSGNEDETGSHAMIFLGHSKDNNWIEVADSAAGKPTFRHKFCVGSITSCGKNFFPLLYVRTPE